MNISAFRISLIVGTFVMLATWPSYAFAQQSDMSRHAFEQQSDVPRYRVAACDWMMLKRQKIGEFQLSRDIGADGVEMDMGPLGKRPMFDNKLREEQFRQQFRHTADSLGVLVPSMAMSGFFAQSFLKRYNYVELVDDCLQSMDVMGATVAFLPLGGSGREWQQPGSADRQQLVTRLRTVGDRAVKCGKVIAIRTGLDAKETLRLLKEVGSKGIKVYYNLQDAVDQGLDPCRELKKLGTKHIAQIHASLTDSVTLDRDPRIDMSQVRRTLDKMGWSGWLVVERSRDAQDVKNVRGNFSRNVKYLKEVFTGVER
jgi:sugar phosphate isomerase/epimerase